MSDRAEALVLNVLARQADVDVSDLSPETKIESIGIDSWMRPIQKTHVRFLRPVQRPGASILERELPNLRCHCQKHARMRCWPMKNSKKYAAKILAHG